MWEIIPDHQENYDELKPKRLGFTYLHGQLESDCGYDCYGLINCDLPVRNDLSSYIDDSLIKDGNYPCKYKDKECTLFFWHCNIQSPHGLVVYNDDIPSMEYAQSQLNLKSYCI